MSKQPETWDEALIGADLVDPRNGKPSLNQLAIRADLPASTVTAIAAGRRKPKTPTIQKIADALGIDVRVVSEWVGQERTERAPYAPPAEADLLTDRQRRAVDEIIRAIVAERADSRDEPRTAAHHGTAPAGRDAVEDPAVTDGTTSRPDTGGHRAWKNARDRTAAAAVDTSQGGTEADANVHLLDSESTIADDRPWEQDEYGLAAKRGRNRGRESREQQDRDAEDGGA